MQRDTVLYLSLAAAVLAFAYSRTKSGAAVVETVANTIGDFVTNRGLRNNNPGNIRRTSTKWQGELSQAEVVGAGSVWDAEFEQFATMGYGVRAIGRTLLTYQSRYGLKTCRQIANRYAPPNENNTERYGANLADALNVSQDTEIDIAGRLPELVAAICKQETGYTDDLPNIRLQVFS